MTKYTTEQKNLQRNKLLGIGIFATATIGLFFYARARPGKATVPIIYPTDKHGAGRVFQTIQTPQEFEQLLSSPASSHGTLFATFVRLGETPSNSMATHMWEIVRDCDTPNTSTVCVELAGGKNDELRSKYMVNSVPCVVAMKKTLPYDIYVDSGVGNSDTEINQIDQAKLKLWVESILAKSV